MPPAIRVDNLGKMYRVAHGAATTQYRMLRDTITAALVAPFRRLTGKAPPTITYEDFWALRDVSFEVQPGEVVGIIGRNGAGKSTLLKVLSRITKPSIGEVEIRGRVGSLLEVGTGFHPELTGRENVYLNGSLLGMSRREIDRKFDEIVAFSEVEQFLDMPVKRYSSGMYVRLAFAVAAHLEPEILIVDEVLAVGDAGFQKKCLGKIRDVGASGRTVFFVSHNLTSVQALCSRAIWMHSGRVRMSGKPHDCIGAYLHESTQGTHADRHWNDTTDAPGTTEVRLLAARVVPPAGIPLERLTTSDPFELEFTYRVLKDGMKLNLSLVLNGPDEACLFASPSLTDPQWAGEPFPAGLYTSRVAIPGDLLNDGLHTANIFFVRDTTVVLHREDLVLGFDIQDSGKDRGDWYGKWVGAVRPRLQWNTTPQGARG
jgi:lipopolysaccharide transport system ATP-binding protein